MKKIALFILGVVFSLASFGQTAQNSMVVYNKKSLPGVSIVLNNYSVDVVDKALKSRFEKGGLRKPSTSKGFTNYQSQPFMDFGTQNYTIYTQLVSPKKSNNVTLNLLVDKGNENFADPNNDPELVERMRDFLANFATTYLSEYDLNLKIDAQTAEIDKLNKEYNALVSDVEKLKKELSAKESSLSAKGAALNRAKEALNALKK